MLDCGIVIEPKWRKLSRFKLVAEVTIGAALPTVTTGGITNGSQASVSVSGEVVSDGMSEITERGVVYATTSGPTVAGTKMTIAGQTGVFTANLTGLDHSTTYFVRAYAVNSEGTAYGDDISFTTDTGVPDIYADHQTHDFDSIEKNTVSIPFTVTVGNQGTAVLNIGAVTLFGTDAAEFSKQDDACSNQTLAPSESRILVIVFNPVSAGDKQAVLSIPSNDPDTPNFEIQLTGEGLDAPTLKGDINGDGDINLEDAILALKVFSAQSGDTVVRIKADVNNDQKIGVCEAIYVIQGLSGLRTLEDQAIP